MATGSTASARGPLHDVFDSGTLLGLDDASLLGRYRGLGDERAFEALVARHGQMVLGVCRRTLRDPHAIDDAFQATFLVLVRKAPTIRRPERLGPWLYGVAYRVAIRARRQAADRDAMEGRPPLADPPDRSPVGPDDELRAVFDEELGRLPEGQRAALVLCALEGLTHDEAAARLGCPVGTVRSRLSRGRERLRGRLERRGFAPAVLASGRFANLLTPAPPVPPSVVEGAIRAVRMAPAKPIGAAVASGAAALAEGVLNAMRLARIKIVLGGLLAVAALGTGSALLATQPGRPADSDTPPDSAPDRSRRPVTESASEPSADSPGHPSPKRTSELSVDPFDGSNLPVGARRAVSPRELRARLQQAMRRFELQSTLFRSGKLARTEFEASKDDLEIVQAQISDETERLEDELELLQAERDVQAAMIEQASARARRKSAELARFKQLAEQRAISSQEVSNAEADADAERAGLSQKEAELRIIHVRIQQVLRRLHRLNPSDDTWPGDREEGPSPKAGRRASPPLRETEPRDDPERSENRRGAKPPGESSGSNRPETR